MPTNLTPANSWATPRGVSSGDAVDPTNTNEGYQANADRTEFIYQRCLNGGNTLWIQTNFRVRSTLTASDWDAGEALGGRDGFLDQNVTNPGVVYFPISLPDGFTAVGLEFDINPADGHGVGEPADKPEAYLYRIAHDGSADVIVAQIADTLDGASYDAIHTVSAAAFSETINNQLYHYVIRYNGERGTGAIANGKVYSIRVGIE